MRYQITKSISLLVIILLGFSQSAISQGSAIEFAKGPYLMFGKEKGDIRVIWQLKNYRESVILRSLGDCNFISSDTVREADSSHLFIHDFKNLKPNQRYYYEIQVAAQKQSGSFYTRPSDSLKEFTFFAYGDTRTNPWDHNTVAEQIMKRIQEKPARHTFILSTGDIVANGNKEEDWQTQLFNRQHTHITMLLCALPYMAAMGNHEGQGELFEKYFPYEFFQNQRYYYSFRYGKAHIIALDQFTKLKKGSEQYKWLENELKNSKSKWKIVMLHKPGYTAGGHWNNRIVRKHLQPLFKKYGVKLVLAGHNHYYAKAEVDNIIHITTGGGGAPLYSPKMKKNIITIDKSNHFLEIRVKEDVMTINVIRADGSTIEKFAIK